MLCETCSEPIEVQSVVRQHNRALRSIVRITRRRLTTTHAQADELFKAICDTNSEAEAAFRELWESGGFQPPIGPQDYQAIVALCVRALTEYRERHTSLEAAEASHSD